MDDIIKKDDLRAFIQSKIYVIRGIFSIWSRHVE